jgi:hypothetical protein
MPSIAVLRGRPAAPAIEHARRAPAAAHAPRAGLARMLLRLWWTGWQAHVRALPPADCRK